MAKKNPPPAVLADACVLVKDVVSFSLFDLHTAGLIALYWTPEIEAEYIEHRARLRAEAEGRTTAAADLMWSSRRIDIVKQHMLPNSTPPGWTMEATLSTIQDDAPYAPLQAMRDKDDIHVAIAAGYLADKLGRNAILVSSNLKDLPQALLTPMGVVGMAPGTLLQLLYESQPAAVAASLLKTSSDFKNPPILPHQMLMSISSSNQFDNPKLAAKLAVDWATAPELTTAKIKGAHSSPE
jgi:hypothetical protein